MTATVEMNLSAGVAGKPTSLAPDLSYGVTDALTVSLLSSTFALTGFRGGAGRGLCLNGTDGGCAGVYDNAGIEGLYALATGPTSFAANVGLHALDLDGGAIAAKVGAKLRHVVGAVSIATSPSMFVGLTERDTNKESLWIPVLAQYKVAPAVALGLGTGFKGPLDGLADRWEVSFGASGVLTLSPAMNVGASWTFGKILGGADATGVDYRAAHLWFSFSR